MSSHPFLSLGERKFPVPVAIALVNKRHSSGSVRDLGVRLRISKKLPKPLREQHIEALSKATVERVMFAIDAERTSYPKLSDGIVVEVYGDRYMIHLDERGGAAKPKVTIKAKSIEISYPPCTTNLETYDAFVCIQRQLRTKLAKHYLVRLTQEIHKLNNDSIMSSKLGSVSLREQHTRWGSCASNGNINL